MYLFPAYPELHDAVRADFARSIFCEWEGREMPPLIKRFLAGVGIFIEEKI
jgi:hypothetical protein